MSNESLYNFTNVMRIGQKRKIAHLKKIFRNIVPALNGLQTLLEIGSGRGEFADIVVSADVNYIGVEPSDSLRGVLESRGLNIVSEPLPEIHLGDESVDAIYSYDVLEHLGNYSIILDFLTEAHRVLKPGGSIIIITPNAETIGHLFYMYDYQHNYFTNRDRIETMLADTGFNITDTRAFLTGFGLSSNKILHAFDRILANVLLLFARSVMVTELMKVILGRKLVFKIHKNLFDHVSVVAKK